MAPTVAQLSGALQELPVGIVIFDSNDRLIFANRAAHELLSLTGPALAEGADISEICGCHLRANSQGEYQTESGRTIETSREATSEGGTVLTLKDVTEDRAAEKELQRSVARFRDLTDIASDWFWEMDQNFQFTFVSNRFTELTDIPTDTFLGRRRGETANTVPGQEEALAANLATMHRQESYRDFRFAVRGRDGGIRVLSVNGAPWYGEDGTFRGYRGTGRDLSEVERLSKALQTQRAQINELMEHAPVPIFFKDSSLRFQVVNDAFYVERGLKPEQVIGRTSDKIFPNAAGRAFTEHDRTVIETGEPVIREHTVGSRIVRTYKFPVYADGAKFLGLGGVEIDITDRIRESQALAAAKTEAERANKAKSYFLAKVSHELRTPLNAVIGFGEMLRAELFGPLGDERYQGYAEDIVSSGRHLLGLVSDILDISKIESDEMDLNEKTLNLSDLVCQAVTMSLAARSEGVATVHTDEVAPEIRLFGDETALQRIVMNLVGNALKFTAPDGRIDVTLATDAKGHVALSVRDTGIGIAEDRLHDVVQPFSTGANPLRLEYEGSGLGLAIVKALCDAHDAVFSIQSKVGVGTVCMALFEPSRSR
ncbi:MAG: PAS domain-containing protein [Alphaproteobacteria bacterium]|nr:PAS domain-containing protein [Alphaproteobacteria bacterium]